MINQAKNYYYESGFGLLLWGFTSLICFTLAYIKATIKGFYLPFNPFLLMLITLALQFYYDRKERRNKQVTSYMDEAHKYVWTAFGISVLILTIAGGFANIGYTVLPLLLLLFAMPTFISGCISKFAPSVFGGIACWLLSIIAFFCNGHITYMLVAAGAGIAWIIPGFILRARFKRNMLNHRNGL